MSPIIGGGGFDISVENLNFIPPWMIPRGARAAQTQNHSTIQPILAYTISHCRTSQKFCIILLITSIYNEDPKFQPNVVLSLHLDVSPSISTHSIALPQVGLVAGRHWAESKISPRDAKPGVVLIESWRKGCTPLKTNMEHKIHPIEMKIIFQTSNFWSYVNFPVCSCWYIDS